MQRKLKLNWEAYQKIGAPTQVIEWLQEGIKIPFKTEPISLTLPNYITSIKHEKFIDEEIKSLLESNTIRKVDFKPYCVHPLKCVPKKKNKLRLVTDCRQINLHIDTPTFTQEGIAGVAELIKPEDDLFSVDLKSGFHHVPIHRDYWKYFGIQWRGQYYVWTFFPFGVSCAPYFFYKVVRPVVVYFRENFIRISPFVDDFLSMSQPAFTTDQRDFILQTFTELGWEINWEKSELEAKKELVFVGYIVSTHGQRGPWLRVTAAKIHKLKRSIKRCLSLGTVTARGLARITGQCISMTKAILPAKLLLRNTYRVLSTRQNWDSLVTLDRPAEQDLRWWYTAVNNWNGAPLGQKAVQAQVETDASSRGWGAVLRSKEIQQEQKAIHTTTQTLNLEASGLWTGEVSFQHSNYRELLAILMGLLSFKELLKGLHVQILSDNITSVAYVNQLGGPSVQMSNLMTTIWQTAQEYNITLSAKHLAGKLNGHADRLSRIHSPYEWRLNPSVFRLLNAMWGPHTVDRFASMRSTQLRRYNSLYWDPKTEGVDCLAQNWTGENNFVNPPFWMLGRILHLITVQQVEATVIAPYWPGQRWFQRLKAMAVEKPVRIRNCPKNFWSLMGTLPEPRKNPQWRLFAWRVSGKRS